jgi:ssDNA-binding Zn-finger/Zn-ribbon topoisomerase 1
MSTAISLEREKLPLCPKCGAKMRLVSGKRGKFYGCTYFPECNGTRPHESEINDGINYDEDEEECFRADYFG